MDAPISIIEEAEAFTREHAELVKLQWESLQSQAYIRMTDVEAQAYDDRRDRIAELCEILGKYKASFASAK
jgi:hypothetical protein